MNTKALLKENLAGTYSFCKNCPSGGNCCSRAKPNGEIDSPFISPSDLRKIGLDAALFSELRKYGDETVRVVKTNKSGCYFYQDGKCSIYSARPIDCRLFPLDIIENPEGQIVWIAYTRLCPVEFDPHEHLEEAKNLLPELGNDIYKFAKINLPGMDKEPYVELGDVFL